MPLRSADACQAQAGLIFLTAVGAPTTEDLDLTVAHFLTALGLRAASPTAEGTAFARRPADLVLVTANLRNHETVRKAPAMEFLVQMTTHVPEGTSAEAIDDIRTREAARSRELAAQGHLLRLWRPPLKPGEWRTLGLFAAADEGQLQEVLASMPLHVWRADEVTPLSTHPNDPALERS
jgi:muconolactone D-isomerase